MSAKRKSVRRHAGVSKHRNYTVDEVARALRVAPLTVRRWLKNGLPAITDRRPSLIMGADLLTFLDGRAKPAQSCGPSECYCVKCRAPREPGGRMAEYVPLTPTSGNLRALCPDCAALMHKRVSWAKLATLRDILDVTIAEASPRITDAPSACVNDHYPKDTNSHA